ncbi:hypothetical protein FLONG3_9324 [Fusarium longipes]|uniref:Uncharacterized protein n=1 Tax=Fusarium longipes TaxID=694270 RepID=A0A395RYJ8_9HYPO|nr:hypothetical protein FLONG3_9324 [Fusarium longipes]
MSPSTPGRGAPVRRSTRIMSTSPTLSHCSKRSMESDEDEESDLNCLQAPKRMKKDSDRALDNPSPKREPSRVAVNLPRSNVLVYRHSSCLASEPDTLADKEETLQNTIDTAKGEIQAKHKLGIKLRKQRAKFWSIVEDCEESIHVEERTIYRGKGDIEFALERLEYMRLKRIKFLRKVGVKQKQLEECYKAIGDAQETFLEAEAEMGEL